MANVNTAAVSGNLTRDPEVRWLAEDGGSAIVNFGLAVNRRRFDKDAGEYVEETSFFDVEVFGGFAVLVAKKLKKADAATIQGRLQQQTWGEGDGKRSKVVIVAEQIDSEAFFRAKDEDNAVVVGERPAAAATQAAPIAATEAASSQGTTADDIPF